MVALESTHVLHRGDEAPDFELPATDGERYSLSDFADYEGLLVVFTCNHCPYAEAKVDTLNAFAEEYDDLAVVGINPNDASEYPDDSFERMRELVEGGTVAYDAYLRDEAQTVAAAYGAVCTPDPFLFSNEDGAFELVYHGRLDDAMNPDDEPTRHEAREAIESLLADEPIDLQWHASRGCSVKWVEGNEPDYWDDV